MATGTIIKMECAKYFNGSISGNKERSFPSACSTRSITIKEINAVIIAYLSAKALIFFNVNSS
jgi:hypothetical protein